MAEKTKKPIILAILDGWGFSKKTVGNPIAAARKPTIDLLTRQYPMTLLQASGLAVGMTWGESGNSEVGHLNIGAGRIVEQYLSRINRAIQNDSFFTNPALAGVFDHAKKNNSRIHIIGLLTSGTAHADFSHLPALIEFARREKQMEAYLHLFSDGKDSGLQEAPTLISRVQNEIKAKGYTKIASIIGRNLAMDRDNNWDLTRKAYELLAQGQGEISNDIIASIKAGYSRGLNDSTMTAIVASDSGFRGIADNDALLFFNFREDSMRQITRPFVETNFSYFPPVSLKNLYICTMTQYLEPQADTLAVNIAFMPPTIVNGLAEVLESSGKHQLHIAETEKYAHITYFFNGLRNQPYPSEIDIFIESMKNHEEKPEMRSLEIAQRVIEEIDKNLHDFIVLNLANADILAHTGNFEATIKGVEAIDNALGIILNKILEKDGVLLVTADHGNAESLLYRASGEIETRHDDSPVPFFLINKKYQAEKTPERIGQETNDVAGILGDVALTILELMDIKQPPEMTGKSLVRMLST
jgi:2,3-bisphosphoglycerate-independent phosphoglycerate mutase